MLTRVCDTFTREFHLFSFSVNSKISLLKGGKSWLCLVMHEAFLVIW